MCCGLGFGELLVGKGKGELVFGFGILVCLGEIIFGGYFGFIDGCVGYGCFFWGC